MGCPQGESVWEPYITPFMGVVFYEQGLDRRETRSFHPADECSGVKGKLKWGGKVVS